MRLIDQSYEILQICCGDEGRNLIETAGRTCYKSEAHAVKSSTSDFIRGLIKRGHESVLEHSLMSVRFITDRGVSHEIVRHRLASFSQESTRYCNYANDKFGNQLTFIIPSVFTTDSKGFDIWAKAMMDAELAYMELINNGYKPEDARSVLPNSIKTELVMTASFREWRHFFQVRAARYSGKAHPQMEELARPLLSEVKRLVPVVFDDIVVPAD